MARLEFDKILDDPTNDQIKRFAETAAASNGNTSQATGALVLSEFYLANTLKSSSENLEKAIDDMTISLKQALADHSEALNESAEASERHANSLKWGISLVL